MHLSPDKLLKRALTVALLLGMMGGVSGVQAQAVPSSDLQYRNGRYYLKETSDPFTGTVEDPGEQAGRVENGYPVGKWTQWHPNGAVSWVGEYGEEGRINYMGVWYENGQLRSERKYVDGMREGVEVAWNEDGSKSTEQTFRQGRLDGERKVWDHEGNLLLTETYHTGVLDGPKTWYFADGAKRWETFYEAGERAGTWKQWDAEGNLFMESEWEAGRLVRQHNPHKGH